MQFISLVYIDNSVFINWAFFVTPILKSRMMDAKFLNCGQNLFFISVADPVHCVSTWGIVYIFAKTDYGVKMIRHYHIFSQT